MAISTEQLSDETRTQLTAAVNCAMQGIPYTIAKDLRPDYPDLKYDLLVKAIKDIIGPASDHQRHLSHARTPRIVIHHVPLTNGQPNPLLDVDMRDFLHKNVDPNNWTEHDVHYARLRDYFLSSFDSGVLGKLLWCEAAGHWSEYVEDVEELRPLFQKLTSPPQTEDIVGHFAHDRLSQSGVISDYVWDSGAAFSCSCTGLPPAKWTAA